MYNTRAIKTSKVKNVVWNDKRVILCNNCFGDNRYLDIVICPKVADTTFKHAVLNYNNFFFHSRYLYVSLKSPLFNCIYSSVNLSILIASYLG